MIAYKNKRVAMWYPKASLTAHHNNASNGSNAAINPVTLPIVTLLIARASTYPLTIIIFNQQRLYQNNTIS